jgi:hypothetical protein
VHAHRHARGLAGDRIVDESRVALGELVGILAPRRGIFARMGIAIARQRRVVELQIGAAGCSKLVHLLPVNRHQV